MRLDWKPEIWCLNPVGLSNPPNFVGHPPLIVKSEKMFDYGIAECNIEASILESPKISGVANDRFDVGEELGLDPQIESNNPDVSSIPPTPIFPKLICAPNVEDAYGLG